MSAVAPASRRRFLLGCAAAAAVPPPRARASASIRATDHGVSPAAPDNTPLLHAARDAAYAAGARDIVLPAGAVLPYRSTFDPGTQLTWHGEGATLRWAVDAPHGNNLNSNASAGLTLEGLIFDGNAHNLRRGGNFYTVAIKRTTGFRMVDCQITNPWGTALYFCDDGVPGEPEGVQVHVEPRFERNTFSGANQRLRNADLVVFGMVAGMVSTGNRFEHCGANACSVMFCKGGYHRDSYQHARVGLYIESSFDSVFEPTVAFAGRPHTPGLPVYGVWLANAIESYRVDRYRTSARCRLDKAYIHHLSRASGTAEIIGIKSDAPSPRHGGGSMNRVRGARVQHIRGPAGARVRGIQTRAAGCAVVDSHVSDINGIAFDLAAGTHKGGNSAVRVARVGNR
jgi:hypothetical protein